MASGKSIDWGQVGKEAAVGAVAGAVSGLVGPEAGPLVRAAVDTGVAVGSQVATNALNGKPLGDGVLMAGAIGLASSVGMGAAVKLGGKVLGKVLGRAAEAAESEVAGAADAAESSVASSVEEGASCALSFSADTPVATPAGEQAIGTLQVGDQVTAYDPATGTTSTQTVQHVWINHDTDLIDVTLHVSDQQGTAASTAKAQRVAVAAHGLRAPPVDAADLTAPAPHDELIHTTVKHPWLTTDRGFVLAGTLHSGERVVREDGAPATVVTVAVRPGAADYYNLTVSVLHTYAVGAGKYVVHNCGPTPDPKLGEDATRAQEILKIATESKRGFVVAMAELKDAAGNSRLVAALNEDAWRSIPKMNRDLVQSVVGEGVDILDTDIAPNVHALGHAHAEDYIRGELLTNGGSLERIGTSWKGYGFCGDCARELGAL